MTRLLFIRHAETDLSGRFCGHTDPPINAQGFRQLAELIDSLQYASIHTVVSSDLLRASMTASAIARAMGLKVAHHAALREIYFGDWENLTWAQIEMRDPAYARRWLESYPALPAAGGEGFDIFERRVVRCVDGWLSDGQDMCTAVITHAGVMRVVLQYYCGRTQDEAFSATAHYCCTFGVPGSVSL